MIRLWRACLVVAVAAGSLLAAGIGSANASSRPASAAELAAARSALTERLVPHSGVGIDPANNQVVLIIADAASGSDGLIAAAKSFGSAVRIDRVPGRFDTLAGHFRGGNGIVGDTGVICTLGFNVTEGKALTAGHCTGLANTWTKENNGQFIGPSRNSQFPVNDFGLIKNTGDMTQRGDVQAYDAGIQEINRAADSFVGEPVCKSGRTTQRTCGTVIVKDFRADYPQGSVFGLDVTTACAQPGDSGGPLYHGDVALGLLSGGNTGSCGPGFRSFFQPVVEALNFYGVDVF